MTNWFLFGISEGDWCNDFLTPPHMWEWLGRGLTRLVGCGQASMLPLVVIVVAFSIYEIRRMKINYDKNLAR